GLLFGVVILARLAPGFAFPPPPLHQRPQRLGMSPRFLRIFLALLPVPAIMQVTFLVFGSSTPLETARGLLHWYPISGLLVGGRLPVIGMRTHACLDSFTVAPALSWLVRRRGYGPPDAWSGICIPRPH